MISTLAEGRQAYVAMTTKQGPHVTPELYAWVGGRLWFASASTTLKAKVLDQDERVGAVVSAGGRSVLLRGNVSRYDIRHPIALACRLRQLPEASLAWTSYVIRNGPDLLAFVSDTAVGRLGSRVPPVRVLFSLEPTGAAVVENDALLEQWGVWRQGRRPRAVSRTVPTGGEPAVAALPGPLAVPGRWFADGRRLRIAAELTGLAGLRGRFPLSVVLDEYQAPGPAAKEGTLLRGQGRLVPGEPGAIDVELDHAVTWDGVETSSHRVRSVAAKRRRR
jgi:hypothetical protein